MIIEMYFSSEDVDAIATYTRVVNAQREWRNKVMGSCQSFGFLNFTGADFSVPDYFYRSRFEHVQRVGGFSMLNDSTLLIPVPDSVPYILRTDYECGRAARRAFAGMAEDALKSLGISSESYGNPQQPGHQKAICILLGINHDVHTGGASAFSQVWLVKSRTGSVRLLCSIPVSTADNQTAYVIPEIPSIWKDISSKEFVTLIINHNELLKEDSL